MQTVSNPLYRALGGGQMPGPFGNMQRMMQQFQQFKNSFQGDPKQAVMNMVNSGQISQQQLNQAQQMAKQFQQMMGGMK